MLVCLKGCYTILGKINSNSKENRIQFTVPLEAKPAVAVDITLDENSVKSFHEFEVSNEMWEALQNETPARDLSKELQDELSMMKSRVNEATRKVLNLIKYCFKQVELNENLFSVKDVYWSVDKAEWKRLPMLGRVVGDVRDFAYLNENTAKIIQKYLRDGLEPLFALRHLHKAKVEGNSRYKWIDATIAAELAIKEFLIRVKPELEPLLLELPSPPLYKLYGQILESYTNERSPKYKEIQKGAEIRNKLVHKPQDVHIDSQEAIKYVQDVEVAIYHLLTLLYPKDPIVKRFSKPRIILG